MELIVAEQKTFYRQYFTSVLHELKACWPLLSFTASFTGEFAEDAKEAELSEWDLFDAHAWLEMAPCRFLGDTGHEQNIVHFGDPDRIYLNSSMIGYTGSMKRIPGDFYFEEMNRNVHQAWKKHRSE